MRSHVSGLHEADPSRGSEVPDGLYLVRVERAQYRWHKQKPYYEIRFAVLKPQTSNRVFDHRTGSRSPGERLTTSCQSMSISRHRPERI